MDKLKERLNDGVSQSAFRFITVDAYLSAIPFYAYAKPALIAHPLGAGLV